MKDKRTERLARAILTTQCFRDDIAVILHDEHIKCYTLAKYYLKEHPATVWFWLHRGSLPRRPWSYLCVHEWAEEIREKRRDKARDELLAKLPPII